MNNKQTALFKETGAFFAFSDKQFAEQRVKDVKYNNMGAGMICPADSAKRLLEGLNRIHINAIAEDIADNGVKAIIHRELGNHECAYLGSYDEVVKVLEPYGITVEQIADEWSEYASKVENY